MLISTMWWSGAIAPWSNCGWAWGDRLPRTGRCGCAKTVERGRHRAAKAKTWALIWLIDISVSSKLVLARPLDRARLERDVSRKAGSAHNEEVRIRPKIYWLWLAPAS